MRFSRYQTVLSALLVAIAAVNGDDKHEKVSGGGTSSPRFLAPNPSEAAIQGVVKAIGHSAVGHGYGHSGLVHSAYHGIPTFVGYHPHGGLLHHGPHFHHHAGHHRGIGLGHGLFGHGGYGGYGLGHLDLIHPGLFGYNYYV